MIDSSTISSNQSEVSEMLKPCSCEHSDIEFLTIEEASKQLKMSETSCIHYVKIGWLNALELPSNDGWIFIESEFKAFKKRVLEHIKNNSYKSPKSPKSSKSSDFGTTLKINNKKSVTSSETINELALSDKEVVARLAKPMDLSPDFELTDVNNNDLIKRVGKRTIAIKSSDIRGLKLEVSSGFKVLVVKSKVSGNNQRCVIDRWKYDLNQTDSKLEFCVNEFKRIEDKLGRKPNTEEFKLHTKKVETVLDALNVHLCFNVVEKHGEGSNEWEEIRRLIRNHITKAKKVSLPNRSVGSVILGDKKIHSVSFAQYKSYLKAFESTVGVHDKIVSRLKAAMNFCIEEQLITANTCQAFLKATRINKERHVEVIDEDMNLLFQKLPVLSEDFQLFFLLQSTGHFRTNQTMKLKFTDFDFNHHSVALKPKNGKYVSVELHPDLLIEVQNWQKNQKSRGIESEYLFPSDITKKHRANYNKEWNELRDTLGFYVVDEHENKEYKYRLHDFRETMLRRLEGCDEQTAAAVLGHTSLYAVKRYREASVKSAAKASKVAFESLRDVLSINS